MDIERLLLPGRGVLSVCRTRSGYRLSVLRSETSVQVELMAATNRGPSAIIALSFDEADSLSDLLAQR